MYWNLTLGKYNELDTKKERKKSVSVLNGFNDNLIKLLVDNDGEIGLDHVMGSAISDLLISDDHESSSCFDFSVLTHDGPPGSENYWGQITLVLKGTKLGVGY